MSSYNNAYGKNKAGARIRMSYHYRVRAANMNLVSLELPDRAVSVLCYGNHLTELHLPEGVMSLHCDKGLIDYDTNKIPSVRIYYGEDY
jgi:hypothetical protein